MKHYLQKINLLGIDFEMPDICTLGFLPGQSLKITAELQNSNKTECKNSMIPLEGKYEQKPPMVFSNTSKLNGVDIGYKRSAEKCIEVLNFET